jgi:hypothetical protein
LKYHGGEGAAFRFQKLMRVVILYKTPSLQNLKAGCSVATRDFGRSFKGRKIVNLKEIRIETKKTKKKTDVMKIILFK